MTEQATHIVGFDVVEPWPILIETFSSFGLKIVDFIDHENVYHIVFEGTYSNLKKWYGEYYDSGESFDDYYDARTQYSFKSMYPKR